MPDTQTSSLGAFVALATGDLLDVVDISDTTMAASGTDRKYTVAQLFGSPSAGQVIYAASGPIPAGAASILVGANGQLNLAEQATPGTQVSGDRWTDSTQHCASFFDGSATSASCLTNYRSGVIYIQNANVTVTATGATTLVSTTSASGTRSLPAGFLNVLNRTIRITARGHVTTAAASPGNVATQIKLGTSIVAASTNVALSTTRTKVPFLFDCTITVKATGASGKLDCSGSFGSAANSITGTGFATQGVQNSTNGTVNDAATQITIDLTAAYTLDFLSNFTAATNSITCTHILIEVIA